jgi:O-antigen ligase
LFVFGLVGTTYGIVFLGVTSTGRALFLPMSVAVLAILVVEPVSEREAAKLLRAIAWIASIYIVLGAVVYSGVWHALLEYRQFKNATFPYVAMGIAAAYLLRRRWWVTVLLGGSLVIFAGYSSATSALVLVTMLLVLWATGTRASPYRPYMIGLALTLAAVLAIVNFTASAQVAQSYFDVVGKRNTSYGRLEFWSTGIAKFEQSPLIGTAFASNTVVDTTKYSTAPYHNDFILFLAEGGLVGAGLLVAWILLLLTDLTRRYFGFVRARAPNHADLARLLLVGLSCFVVSMVFNPVLEGLSRSATIFALAAIASTLGTPAPAVDATRPSTADATTRAIRADLRTPAP